MAEPMTLNRFVWMALYVWLVGAVLGLVFGFLAWIFGGGSGALVNVLKAAFLWPAHFAGLMR